MIMAILKPINKRGKYHDLDAREELARYIFNPQKMYSGYCGGVGVTEDVVGSMNEIASRFEKTKGVQLRHMILSFSPEEIDDPEIVNEIACHVAMFIGQEFQVVFAVHENTENLHVHFMQNHISYKDGHRYSGSKKEYYNLVNFLRKLLWEEYRIRLMTASPLSDKDVQ